MVHQNNEINSADQEVDPEVEIDNLDEEWIDKNPF
jgi:hypothetical protein